MSNEYKDWQAEEIKDLEAQVEEWAKMAGANLARAVNAEAKVERLEKALDYVYRDCKARAVDGVVPLGASCWDMVVEALEGKQE